MSSFISSLAGDEGRPTYETAVSQLVGLVSQTTAIEYAITTESLNVYRTG